MPVTHGVFISYSHLDVDTVNKVVDIIHDEVGVPVWYDHNLHGGDHYFSIIAEQILEYEYFIFVVSRHSVASEFCTMELEFAKSEKRKIIALWLEDFMPPPRIRMVISHTHYIRLFALAENDLQKELESALQADQLRSNVTTTDAPQISERLTDQYKYFVRDEDKLKMQKLLQLEQDEKYSICFEPQSAVLLGLAYELGIHTEKDLRQAEFYYRVAAHKGNMDGEFFYLMMGIEQDTVNKYEVLPRLRELAENGSEMAMVYFGDDLYYGRWDMEPDKETAYRWWHRAAQMGNAMAQYFLSFGYRMGEVVGKDALLSLMYSREAAETHFPRAYRSQGFLYKNGEFVEQDKTKAKAMFEKAVSLGDYLSLKYIGDLYWYADDFETAVTYYRQAVEHAEAGRVKSGAPYYDMGYAYRFGKGVEEDRMRAIELYLKGAERSHKQSLKWAAIAIDDDVPDREPKLALLKKASDLNCRGAEYFIGRTLEQGEPSHEQLVEALAWYEKGVDKGCVDCMLATVDYYGLTGSYHDFADRTKALANLRLFFSLWESEQDNVKERSIKKEVAIGIYYYMYAVELDLDETNNKPDHALAMYYFQKLMENEEGIRDWRQCTLIAYLYAHGNGSGFTVNVNMAHAEELALLLHQNMDRYLEYDREHPNDLTRLALMRLYQCWGALAAYYKKLRGNHQYKVSLYLQYQNEVKERKDRYDAL